ncbi:Major facilitator superfamily permease [Lactobacillus kullabergensis]|uniref:Major facilitator superfamily permease n=1 Tax=Lactobacillus kullabergensis TaxID=1218493 RepID=A0A0F4L9I9_9LACO|nr:MFS transporter [Lactobacillus kullabergensis]KJY54256.1 Major facilitator superfamily permease [Lactobacillus kullabergensis]
MTIFFKNKEYRKFSIASILSSAGDILFYLALMTYASRLKNYSLALSLIAISESVPRLFSSVGGYLADRTQNKFQKIVWMAMIRGALYLLVGFLFSQNIAGWNLVIMVIIINFISDTAGTYSGGLTTPLVISLVKKDEIAEAEGFTSGVSQVITLVSQFVGSGLLLFMSYSALAVINGLTFIVAGLIYYNIAGSQRKKGIATVTQEVDDRGFWATLVLALKQVKKASGLITTVLVIAVLNGVLSTIEPLISIVIAGNRQEMVIGTYSFTIALIGAMAGIGAALGSIFGTNLFKNVSLYIIIIFANIAGASVIIAILSKQIWFCLITYCILGFFAGTATPKLTQWMVGAVDRKILASSVGLINTILLIASPLMTTAFTTLSAVTNVQYSLLGLLIVSILLFAITVLVMRKSAQKAQ